MYVKVCLSISGSRILKFTSFIFNDLFPYFVNLDHCVTFIPIIVVALGTVSKELENYIEQLGITIRLEHLQKTALLGTARILRKVLEE